MVADSEENIWHLCQEKSLLPFPRKVLFITSQQQYVAINHQKAGSPVYWDYHVVLLFEDQGWKIADLDTLLPFPCPVEEYLTRSFIPKTAPVFRVVDADQYIEYFTSDRRHMIDKDGNYLQPPPPWDPIGESGFNLWDFVGISEGKFGKLHDLEKMYSDYLDNSQHLGEML